MGDSEANAKRYGLLVEGVNELDAKDKRIAELEAENSALQSQIKELEDALMPFSRWNSPITTKAADWLKAAEVMKKRVELALIEMARELKLD